MSSISSLLNLNNMDYQSSLFNRKKEREEEEVQIVQKKLDDASTLQKMQEQNSINQQAMRQVHEIDQEIQKLSLAQAQIMMQAITDRIAQSTLEQLAATQAPGERGLLPAAYI